MKKILLTCFEPFGGETINPSAEAMKNVIPPFGCELIKLQLPVLWEGAEKLLFDAIDDFSPDSVLLVIASTHYDGGEYIRDYDEYLKEIGVTGQ